MCNKNFNITCIPTKKIERMNLTLRDRVIILNTVLPQYDTRANMMLKIAIDNKIFQTRSKRS